MKAGNHITILIFLFVALVIFGIYSPVDLASDITGRQVISTTLSTPSGVFSLLFVLVLIIVIIFVAYDLISRMI